VSDLGGPQGPICPAHTDFSTQSQGNYRWHSHTRAVIAWQAELKAADHHLVLVQNLRFGFGHDVEGKGMLNDETSSAQRQTWLSAAWRLPLTDRLTRPTARTGHR